MDYLLSKTSKWPVIDLLFKIHIPFFFFRNNLKNEEAIAVATKSLDRTYFPNSSNMPF